LLNHKKASFFHPNQPPHLPLPTSISVWNHTSFNAVSASSSSSSTSSLTKVTFQSVFRPSTSARIIIAPCLICPPRWSVRIAVTPLTTARLFRVLLLTLLGLLPRLWYVFFSCSAPPFPNLPSSFVSFLLELWSLVPHLERSRVSRFRFTFDFSFSSMPTHAPSTSRLVLLHDSCLCSFDDLSSLFKRSAYRAALVPFILHHITSHLISSHTIFSSYSSLPSTCAFFMTRLPHLIAFFTLTQVLTLSFSLRRASCLPLETCSLPARVPRARSPQLLGTSTLPARVVP